MYFVQVDYTMSYWLVFKLCVFISRDHYSVVAFPGILLLVGCYSYDGLFRHSTDLSGFFPGTPMEAIMDCYPYDSLLRHCVKYARFFPGTPMEAITDCYPYGSLFRHCVKYAGFFPGTPMDAIMDCYLHMAFLGITT